MKNNMLKLRAVYAVLFVAIFVIEVLIALFVRDAFIRPYGGDILVTILICCFVRIFLPEKVKLLPVWVFLFALAVEIGQYFDYVSLLGLGDSKFFSIVLGTGFSIIDIFCYALGCVIFFVCEKFWLKR
ncbi:MAG: DUF2809 domain-containing protein [Ruminococcaceae bacterium]|nr:DUF2809 domain-containing protein [Oscillospiraceae bacterium]